MITNAKIKMVDHPHASEMRKVGKPDRYLALTYNRLSQEGYNRGTSHINMKYVELILKQDVRAKFITTVEYLELLSIVKEYKNNVSYV